MPPPITLQSLGAHDGSRKWQCWEGGGLMGGKSMGGGVNRHRGYTPCTSAQGAMATASHGPTRGTSVNGARARAEPTSDHVTHLAPRTAGRQVWDPLVQAVSQHAERHAGQPHHHHHAPERAHTLKGVPGKGVRGGCQADVCGVRQRDGQCLAASSLTTRLRTRRITHTPPPRRRHSS